MRGAAAAVAILLAGCLSTPQGSPTDPSTFPAVDLARTYFLKAAYTLDQVAPTKSEPDRLAATPMVNGFANEDLRVYASAPIDSQWNVTSVRLTIFYEVAAPSLDPFPNTSNPQQARQIVFWIGSDDIYPASVSTMGDTVLVPGRVYKVEATIPMPAPGWIVPAAEPLQLLIATLSTNDRGAELRFLVDSVSTPSRIELAGVASALPVPTTLQRHSQEFEILANSGLFTGATGDRVPSKVRVPIEVVPGQSYLEARALLRSNAGGKSDLDFDLFAPDGQLAAQSSTPYQSETLRMLAPNLAVHGFGVYQAEIVAYSGAQTRFTLETFAADGT